MIIHLFPLLVGLSSIASAGIAGSTSSAHSTIRTWGNYFFGGYSSYPSQAESEAESEGGSEGRDNYAFANLWHSAPYNVIITSVVMALCAVLCYLLSRQIGKWEMRKQSLRKQQQQQQLQLNPSQDQHQHQHQPQDQNQHPDLHLQLNQSTSGRQAMNEEEGIEAEEAALEKKKRTGSKVLFVGFIATIAVAIVQIVYCATYINFINILSEAAAPNYREEITNDLLLEVMDAQLALFNHCCHGRGWSEQGRVLECVDDFNTDCSTLPNQVSDFADLLCVCVDSQERYDRYVAQLELEKEDSGSINETCKAFESDATLEIRDNFNIPGTDFGIRFIIPREYKEISLVGDPSQNPVDDPRGSFGCGLGFAKGFQWAMEEWFKQQTSIVTTACTGLASLNIFLLLVALITLYSGEGFRPMCSESDDFDSYDAYYTYMQQAHLHSQLQGNDGESGNGAMRYGHAGNPYAQSVPMASLDSDEQQQDQDQDKDQERKASYSSKSRASAANNPASATGVGEASNDNVYNVDQAQDQNIGQDDDEQSQRVPLQPQTGDTAPPTTNDRPISSSSRRRSSHNRRYPVPAPAPAPAPPMQRVRLPPITGSTPVTSQYKARMGQGQGQGHR